MQRLELQLKPSKAFFLIMLFILGGALVSIICAGLPYYIKLVLLTLSASYGSFLIGGTVLLREQKAIVALFCREDHTWLLKERSGKEYPAFLCGESTRFLWISILCFRPIHTEEGRRGFLEKRRSAVIFYDSVDAVCYRRLQLNLSITTIH